MDLQTYQHEAMRTAGQTSIESMLGNSAQGLPEEASEVLESCFYGNWKDVQGEIGDIMWYLAQLCTALNWPMSVYVRDIYEALDDVDDKELRQAVDLLVIQCGKLDGVIKKHLYHGHELDREALEVYTHQIVYRVVQVCVHFKFTLAEAMEANIAKLRKRYGEKFSSDASINRVE